MIEVTDKMVEAACETFYEWRWSELLEKEPAKNGARSLMRAAIEAALATREPAGVDKADAVIEELVDALKPFAEIATELSDEIGDRKNTMQWAVPYAGDLRRALTILTRMGVKL